MEAATAAQAIRTEFRNETDGVVGYVRINAKTGEEIGDFVRPGDTEWLTDDEIAATHRAPRTEAGSPFVARSIEVTEEVADEEGKVSTKTRTVELPPLLTKIKRGQPPVFDLDELATPGAAEDAGASPDAPVDDAPPAPEGDFAPGEEQGTQT